MKQACLRVAVAAMVFAVPARAEESPPDKSKSTLVPYRLTATKHILVRAKINGKGPFNFILDTGAPMLFMVPKVADKIGVKPGRDKIGTFEDVELEGGLHVPKVKARIEEVFQIEGMNGLGLAGVELHGVIGYNVLARYRIEFDFTSDKLTLTPLDFEPEAPMSVGAKAPAGLDAIGSIMKLLGSAMGRKAHQAYVYRGFLGIELSEAKDGVRVKSVLASGPGSLAGLKPGDRITALGSKTVQNEQDFYRRVQRVEAGGEVKLTVERGTEKKVITLKAADGI